MMEWWLDRTEREQRLIMLAGGVIAAVVVIQFLLVPLNGYRLSAKTEFDQAQSYLSEVQSLAAQLEQQRGGPQQGGSSRDGTSVRATVTSEAARMELQVSRLQPGNDGELTVWLEDADPGRVMTWLVELSSTRGLALGAVSMRQTTTAGEVQTQVTFLTGGSE